VAILRKGVSYFGNRTLRHVAADLADIANAGFDYVVHCSTESDLLWGQETMREIYRISHELGLEVHVDPWGVAGVFGGEALSKFVTWEIDRCQVLADGSRMGVACLNQPKLLDWLHEWIDAAVDQGADALFFDEPHWYPGDLWYIGHEVGPDSERWSCRCDACLELFGRVRALDAARVDDEVRAFGNSRLRCDGRSHRLWACTGCATDTVIAHGMTSIWWACRLVPFWRYPTRFHRKIPMARRTTVPLEPYERPMRRRAEIWREHDIEPIRIHAMAFRPEPSTKRRAIEIGSRKA